ncbi:MAG: hypothetical protein EB060_01705 [Proteobacteria bacterium]|nr:hypothetical protein [Pseudomonadota bacterium]
MSDSKKPSVPTALKSSKINKLNHVNINLPTTPRQIELDLHVEKQVNRDGVDMGVLSDGTAFLSGRGLARLCGVSNSIMSEIMADWNTEKPRIKRIKEILGGDHQALDSPIVGEVEFDGAVGYAWPEDVCLAVLEYYAIDAQQGSSEHARKNFRLLAGKGLHDLIYKEVGYDPNYNVPEKWRIFHDRMSLVYNSVPVGYFGIFKEIADMIVHLGQNGVHIDSSFVPDISVGIAWGKHWADAKLDEKFGTRIKFEHNYPEYFAQAKSNPQEPWCYPEAALGEFRRWLREDYIGDGKFAKYLEGAVKKKAIPLSFAQLAIAAYQEAV